MMDSLQLFICLMGRLDHLLLGWRMGAYICKPIQKAHNARVGRDVQNQRDILQR